MNKDLENRLRQKVRKLVESVIKEETPMPSSGFKSKPATAKRLRIGSDLEVVVSAEGVSIDQKASNIYISREDAKKLADYLIRIVGKV